MTTLISRKNGSYGKKYIITLFLILFLSGITISSALEPQIEQEIISPDNIYIGTPLVINYSITTARDIEVYHPVRDTLGIFSILDIKTQVTTQPDRDITLVSFRVAPFETGEQAFPPLTFELFDNIQNRITTIRSSPVRIEVLSVLTDEDMDLRDIRGPFRLGLGFWDYLIPLVILLILIAIVYFIWKRLRSRKGDESGPEILDSRPPYQKALDLLECLKSEKLLEKGKYLDYYFKLSYILRFFLEEHYHFNAVEMTSSEIKQVIRDFPADVRKELTEFLQETDLIKFAKYEPFVNSALEHTTWLEKYLRSFALLVKESDQQGEKR